MPMWYWWGSRAGHYAGWLWWLGPVLMVVFWGLVITAIVLVVRYLVRHGRGIRSEDSALEILRRRYASGEIGKEEYEQKRRDLER